MPLYQPTNIFPSSFAGQGGGTVDASQPLTVSWQVNGSSAMTGYQIEIFQNTTASARVYNSGQVTIPPFWGVSSTGQTQYYSVTIPSPGLTNGYAPGYKLQITQFWNGGSIQQISPSYFITRAAPALSIRSFTNPVAGRTASFAASYAQAQGNTLDWFRWMLCEAGHENDPLEDSGNIYGSGDIQVSYDGLFTGTNYRVRCMIQTENGVQADTGWVDFSVTYAVSDMLGYVEACLHPIEGIVLRWPRVSYIPGSAQGPYGTGENGLDLPAGSSVTWEEKNGGALTIDAPWTLAWSGYLPAGGTSPVLTIAPGITFRVTPTRVRLRMNNTDLWSDAMPEIVSDLPMSLVITPREVHFYYAVAVGGLFPAETLYPSDTLYPDGGTYSWRRITYPLTWIQPDIAGLTLHGAQVCRWLTVIDGEVSGALLNSLLTDLAYEPSWTLDTRFLATFDLGLNGGNITPVGDSVTGVALYRRKEGESRLRLVANLDIGVSTLIDEGFRNQETYTYYLFAVGATYVSDPLISRPVTPMFWNWTVLDTAEENGAYHVKNAHVFRNSVSTDSITNNNSPQFLQNFTPYPNRQPSSYNYQSSTLTGYIGKVDYARNIYYDTVDMADELRALSVSTAPKFLRDRKGNLWRIETAAPVSFQTGDKQVPQPYFGTFPWAETGSADGVSIISGEGDWTGGTGTAEQTDRAAIVITAPAWSAVTISHNGSTVLSQPWTGPVTYYPPEAGSYTVSAAGAEGSAAETVAVSGDETWYVGLVFEGLSVIEAIGPSGSTVTVTGNGFSETKEVP